MGLAQHPALEEAPLAWERLYALPTHGSFLSYSPSFLLSFYGKRKGKNGEAPTYLSLINLDIETFPVWAGSNAQFTRVPGVLAVDIYGL